MAIPINWFISHCPTWPTHFFSKYHLKCHWSEEIFCGFASYFMYKTWNQQRFALKNIFDAFFLMKTSSMFHFCMAKECARPRAQQPRFRVDSSSSWRHTVDTAQIRKRYNMESQEKKKKRGGKYGVAGISSKESCKNNSHTEGISIHLFPKDEEVRWKWIKFVQQRRADFFGEAVNSADSSLCSGHFEGSCFTRKPAVQLERMKFKRT